MRHLNYTVFIIKNVEYWRKDIYMKKEVLNYLFIIIGSILYAIATVVFIFPHSLLLGGTSGISVILNEYISFSLGTSKHVSYMINIHKGEHIL